MRRLECRKLSARVRKPSNNGWQSSCGRNGGKRKSAEEAKLGVRVRKRSNSESLLSGPRGRAPTNQAQSNAALISQGTADSNAGDYDRAITHYNEAIRLDPKSAVAFMNRGDAYMNKGNNDRAIADYNEAIRLDPKSALALIDRGVAYAKKGDTTEPSPILMRRFDSIPRVLTPLGTGASPIQEKAT